VIRPAHDPVRGAGTVRVRSRGVSLHVETAGAGAPLVLLHGFTGSGASWARHVPAFATRFCTVTIDLLGHGRSEAPAHPDRYRIERAADDILAVLDQLSLSRAAILGYSMGGRLALFLATAAPERIGALVLESSSPGIRDEAERRDRAGRDAALADAIERDGIAAFVDRWERLPLFATQVRLPDAERAALRAQRLAQSPAGLANSLRGMGQGVQPPLFERLASIRMPALILVGALDRAYCALGGEMAGLIPHARLAIIPDAGHTVHLEQPEAFRRTVDEFLMERGGNRCR
jgi:2-succinyl-6-hydroxy-2,4-cyclohexadiene-1-carboxylate synthase